MYTLKLNVQDSILDKVIYFLKNLPQNEVEIVENKLIKEDWSYLESHIDIGLDSGISDKSHDEIINDIKRKYV